MQGNNTQQDIERFLNLFGGNKDLAIQAINNFKELPAVEKPIPRTYGPDIIKVNGVSKNYKLGKKQVPALNGVSVNIKEGEFVALTGPSGSGKSTLLQIIGGLDKPSTGSVVVNGQDISRLSDTKLSNFRNKTVGYVFQFFYLQPFLNTKVNLEVPGMFARLHKVDRTERATSLAEAVNMSDRLNHLPKELSGGQMQRVAIARAMLNKPKLLLADEPTGNLDRTNGTAIIDLFEEVRQKFGTTILIVTHDKEIAARADREIRLIDGVVQ
jgi:ABC-type lipoprotein export system ATPase subunit